MSAPVVEREQWSRQTGFLLAAIGSAIGLGNIWRFPGVAYDNGGGAFLIPYLVALLTAGIPILLLDYSLGHRYRGSAPTVFRRLWRPAEGLGWFQVMVSFVIMCYYAMVLAWALSYTFFSVSEAWGDDPAGFFIGEYLQAGEPGLSFDVVAGLLVPLAIVWLAVLVVLVLGVQRGLERTSWLALPVLALMFLILVVRALFLDGAMDGLNAFFTPDFAALGDPQVWLAAYSQIFFSLSIAFGIMITYSSYLSRRSDLSSTGLVAAFANSSFELLAGIGVFATLGFMAFQQSLAVDDLEGIAGVSLSFITFPQVISMMPGGPIFGVLFFGSLVLAGFTSMVSIAQVVIAAVNEKFRLGRAVSTIVVVGVCGTISVLLFATTSGLFTLDTVDKFINEIGIVLSAVAMTVLVSLGLRRLPVLQRHLNAVSTFQVGGWWRVLVGIVTPLVLVVMLATTVGSLIGDGYEGYPTWFLTSLGWGAVAFAVVVAAFLTLLPWRHDVDDFVPDDTAGAPAGEARP